MSMRLDATGVAGEQSTLALFQGKGSWHHDRRFILVWTMTTLELPPHDLLLASAAQSPLAAQRASPELAKGAWATKNIPRSTRLTPPPSSGVIWISRGSCRFWIGQHSSFQPQGF
jgi:hypothetical protein